MLEMSYQRSNILDNILPSLIIVTIVSLSSFAFYYKFLCIKEYFPKMTFWEYLILEDKVMVVPDGKDAKAEPCSESKLKI